MQKTLAFYATLLYKNFFAYTSEQLQSLGLSYGLLPFILYLGKHPGCTQSQMTAALHMDWGHSQRSIAKLIDGGFATKQKVPGNSRINHLDLTETGKHAFEVSHQVFYRWDEQILGGLSSDEQAQLLALLHKAAGETEATCHE